MDIVTLRDLFEEQIRDLHSGEKQIIDALPEMIEATTDSELQNALRNHLEETREQLERLEKVGKMLDFRVKGETCDGMKGIIKEGNKLVTKDVEEDEVRDAAIVAALQRVEHYEIAVYGTVTTFARMLGEDQVLKLLQTSLDEEKEADATLTRIAEAHVNRRAMASGD